MSRNLILDPRSERAENVPVEIMTEPGLGPGAYATSHRYPDPEQEVREAQGREGRRRSGAPRLGNRQIPLGLWLMGEQRTPGADLVNLATNPAGALEAKFQSGAEFAVVRQPSWVDRIPSRLGEHRDRHAFDSTGPNTDNSAGNLPMTFTAAGDYTASLWVWIPAAWDGGAPRIAFSGTYVGAVLTNITSADLAKRDQWQRIAARAAIATGDLVGSIVVRSGTGSGDGFPSSDATGIFYSDCLQIETGQSPTEYFDGDSLGCRWAGTPLATTSSKPGDPDDHFEQMAADLEEKLAQLRDGGGTFSRPFRAGRVVFDVEGLASADRSQHDGRRWRQRGAAFEATLEALPHPRGTSQMGELRVEAANPVLVFTEDLIPGPVKALGELEIIDDQGEHRRGVVAGIEVYDYSPDATAALYYQAEALTPVAGAVAARAGAAGGSVIAATLTPEWTTILRTPLAGGAPFSHVGLFRIWARVYAPAALGVVQARIEWAQGDLERSTLNPIRRIGPDSRIPVAGTFWLVDFGLVRLRRPRAGEPRWEARILSRSDRPDINDSLEIDDLRIVPAGEAYLEAAAPLRFPQAASLAALDTFPTGGDIALAGQVADLGGTWAEVVAGTGAALKTIDGYAYRTSAGGTAGKLLAPDTALLQDVTARAAIAASGVTLEHGGGVAVRVQNATNYLAAFLYWDNPLGDITGALLRVNKIVAGVETTLYEVALPTVLQSDPAAPSFYAVELLALASGHWGAWVSPAGAARSTDPLAQGYDAALDTGALAPAGKVGIIDDPQGQGTIRWGELVAWNALPATGVTGAVINPNKRLRWGHDDVDREDAAGDLYSPVGHEGDLLYVPPATREGRVCRVIAFASRGDLGELPDTAIDDTSARLTLIPRYLNVRA